MTSCHPIVGELAASVMNHEVSRLRLPHQFCDESLELLMTWKLDRLWKSALRRKTRTNLDELSMTKQLDCRWTRKWWLIAVKEEFDVHA